LQNRQFHDYVERGQWRPTAGQPTLELRHGTVELGTDVYEFDLIFEWVE
jgi:hypothetical protein